MKKPIIGLILLIGFAIVFNMPRSVEQEVSPAQQETTTQQDIAEWRAGQQVQGAGQVVRILSDDNDGSRHQRFILELSPGRTVLVAHNIDLAPRVPSLREGDRVSFYGEYETNPQGGVIHWTHHDPQGMHVAGWLEHNGKRYQ